MLGADREKHDGEIVIVNQQAMCRVFARWHSSNEARREPRPPVRSLPFGRAARGRLQRSGRELPFHRR
jgi:hypothetical protein